MSITSMLHPHGIVMSSVFMTSSVCPLHLFVQLLPDVFSPNCAQSSSPWLLFSAPRGETNALLLDAVTVGASACPPEAPSPEYMTIAVIIRTLGVLFVPCRLVNGIGAFLNLTFFLSSFGLHVLSSNLLQTKKQFSNVFVPCSFLPQPCPPCPL